MKDRTLDTVDLPVCFFSSPGRQLTLRKQKSYFSLQCCADSDVRHKLLPCSVLLKKSSKSKPQMLCQSFSCASTLESFWMVIAGACMVQQISMGLPRYPQFTWVWKACQEAFFFGYWCGFSHTIYFLWGFSFDRALWAAAWMASGESPHMKVHLSL